MHYRKDLILQCFYFRFKQSVALVQHQRIHSGDRPHACTYCSKSFTQVTHLINHERTHTGETPFVCQVCHHGFKQASGLLSHTKTHENIKTYECEFCSKSFATEKGLLNHETVHSEEKRHKCLQCKRTFAREANLALHMKTHKATDANETMPYACGTCKRHFETEVLLLAHKALCMVGKPFRFMAYDDMFPQSNQAANLGEPSGACAAEVVVTIDSSGDIDSVEISALVNENEQSMTTDTTV